MKAERPATSFTRKAERMLHIDLTSEERTLMEEMLDAYLTDLRGEISATPTTISTKRISSSARCSCARSSPPCMRRRRSKPPDARSPARCPASSITRPDFSAILRPRRMRAEKSGWFSTELVKLTFHATLKVKSSLQPHEVDMSELHVVTGAFGYSGKYITTRLLDAGARPHTDEFAQSAPIRSATRSKRIRSTSTIEPR